MYLLCLSAIDISCIVITLAMIVIVYMVTSTHDTILTNIIDIYSILEIQNRTPRFDTTEVDELKKEVAELKAKLSTQEADNSTSRT